MGVPTRIVRVSLWYDLVMVDIDWRTLPVRLGQKLTDVGEQEKRPDYQHPDCWCQNSLVRNKKSDTRNNGGCIYSECKPDVFRLAEWLVRGNLERFNDKCDEQNKPRENPVETDFSVVGNTCCCRQFIFRPSCKKKQCRGGESTEECHQYTSKYASTLHLNLLFSREISRVNILYLFFLKCQSIILIFPETIAVSSLSPNSHVAYSELPLQKYRYNQGQK